MRTVLEISGATRARFETSGLPAVDELICIKGINYKVKARSWCWDYSGMPHEEWVCCVRVETVD